METKDVAMNRIAHYLRGALITFLNKSLPYLYLGLNHYVTLHVYFPSDGFRALEENLLVENIYFDKHSIRNADTIIDLGAHAGSFTIYAILCSKPKTRIIAVEPNEKTTSFYWQTSSCLGTLLKRKTLKL